jgi:hypothetical protein
MRTFAFVGLLVLAACSSPLPPRDHGPPPGPDHEVQVRVMLDGIFDQRYRLEQASDYRFAEPVRDRVASWHWERVPEGQSHALGYRYGWRVDFRVTPHYAGYPPQPESPRMAFFADGELRGIFGDGCRQAPLDLDRWAPDWVDLRWHPKAAVAAPAK